MPLIIDLMNVSDESVANTINHLSSISACGPDHITSFMEMSGRAGIVPVLTHIFNLSLCQKSFPTVWKHAKVTPVCLDHLLLQTTDQSPCFLLLVRSLNDLFTHNARNI